jgi:hypothetical protein
MTTQSTQVPTPSIADKLRAEIGVRDQRMAVLEKQADNVGAAQASLELTKSVNTLCRVGVGIIEALVSLRPTGEQGE